MIFNYNNNKYLIQNTTNNCHGKTSLGVQIYTCFAAYTESCDYIVYLQIQHIYLLSVANTTGKPSNL